MGTLTSLLSIANSALQADQAALNVTANNVANQNTVGYTREIVNFQTQDSILIGNASYGQGVTTGDGATSVRDRVLEQRVQQQTQVQAESSAVASALTAVESVFQLSRTPSSASTTTLGSAIDALYNSFTTLAANPSDASTRRSVLSAASALAGAFNTAASQLASNSGVLNGEVTQTVGQINSLTANIADLNHQIALASPNADAGVLEDKRQASIAQLSQLIGLDQIASGQNGISLSTSSGTVLVSADQAYALQASPIAGVTHILAGPGAVDVTAAITGGSLGGVLKVRDQQLPTFSGALDNLAYAIGSQVNAQNSAGLDGTGAPGIALFTLAGAAAGAAGTIAVTTSNPNDIAAAAAGEGKTGNGNALALAGQAGSASVSGQTPSSFFASFLGQLGTAVSSAVSGSAVQQAALTQLTSIRDATSVVSLDQEAANLTQYQRSYQAAAKVFSIVDQLLAAALNLGVTTSFS